MRETARWSRDESEKSSRRVEKVYGKKLEFPRMQGERRIELEIRDRNRILLFGFTKSENLPEFSCAFVSLDRLLIGD